MLTDLTLTGLTRMDAGLIAMLFIGVSMWMYSLCGKPRRKQPAVAKKAAHQPWGDDKDGGRVNR